MRINWALGVVKWSVLAAMACLVLWQQFGVHADGAGSTSVGLSAAEKSEAAKAYFERTGLRAAAD